MGAKTIGIISLKGGVGKTTTVVNLGAVLSNEFSKKVLIVDANLSAPNLGLHVGIINPQRTLHDVLNDKIDITQSIRSHELGFDIIPASLTPKVTSPMKLKNKLEKIKSKYDIILIDSSPTLNQEILTTMNASDELLVVTGPDYPTLITTVQAVKSAKKKGAKISGIIVNKVKNKKHELNLNDIEDATGIPVLSVIPDQDFVSEALASCIPGAVYAPNKDFSIEYMKLAAALIGETYEDKRILSKIKGFFRPDLMRAEVNRMLFSK